MYLLLRHLLSFDNTLLNNGQLDSIAHLNNDMCLQVISIEGDSAFLTSVDAMWDSAFLTSVQYNRSLIVTTRQQVRNLMRW